MGKAVKGTIALALSFSLLPLCVRGEQQIGEKWALIIGVETYKKEINPVQYAENDARELAKALKEIADFDKVVLLTTAEKEEDRIPTRNNIINWLAKLAEESKEPGRRVDLFLFFFAGHGMEKGGKAFLLPKDADPSTLLTLEFTCLDTEMLKKFLRDIKARSVLIFLDCCRNKPQVSPRGGIEDNFATQSIIEAARDIVPKPREEAVSLEAKAVIMACKEGQRAYACREKKHGFFTYFLLEALKGKAPEALDDRGRVTPGPLSKYLAESVLKAVKSRLGKEQEPWSALEGKYWEMEICRPPVSSREATITVRAFYKGKDREIRGAKVLIDGKEVGVTPLLKYPVDMEGKFAKEVRISVRGRGFKTWISTRKVRAGRELSVRAELEPLPVSVIFSTDPEGATIILNGKELDITPFT